MRHCEKDESRCLQKAHHGRGGHEWKRHTEGPCFLGDGEYTLQSMVSLIRRWNVFAGQEADSKVLQPHRHGAGRGEAAELAGRAQQFAGQPSSPPGRSTGRHPPRRSRRPVKISAGQHFPDELLRLCECPDIHSVHCLGRLQGPAAL